MRVQINCALPGPMPSTLGLIRLGIKGPAQEIKIAPPHPTVRAERASDAPVTSGTASLKCFEQNAGTSISRRGRSHEHAHWSPGGRAVVSACKAWPPATDPGISRESAVLTQG